jgi:photosystem II stability/assembly factor-like uncharacterized protein
MRKTLFLASLLSTSLLSLSTFAQKKPAATTPAKGPFDESAISALSFRLVGPALTSGRISDIAIHPSTPDTWFVAAASGGVWKTINHGTTFTPIFDGYGSYSIGCVKIAPSNPNTIWVGSGENNNQRSVSYGDGVYKSVDGGASFTNMGLPKSEHIANIVVHPTDENTVWVAAYGPVWKEGGERGVYKTTDGGKTWKRTLFVSEETGISELVADPKNPNVLYAAAHQRRRHEWTYVGGGPESALYKSTDGGETWKEISSGLPKGDMGRIAICVSQVNSDNVYAMVEARYDKDGFYKSTNRGESFTKMSGYSTAGNYYQEIMSDPKIDDKVYVMDTWLHLTTDGGKNVVAAGEDKKHVDNHAIWVDPNNANHWIVGCDGGLYETYNHAKDWKYFDNLPIIQFYKVATDNAYPFYNIYGGTQDNNSMGGPSASINNAGVLNSDWFITNGGDGFESAIDWKDNNVVYAQSQYGGLVRYDKISGEKTYIQPMPGKGEAAYRWNWDAPLLVSPHNNQTIYFAANKVFKSANRGNDWQTVSPDLSRQIDRNKLKVMGQVWSIDAVQKNGSTTIYGNIIALDESPKKEGLLYAGTDDGLIQVSDNGGSSWTKIETFVGVPAQTRVNQLHASPLEENVVFACFNNQRNGDFKPYLMKSSDKGKTWVSISGDLPERGTVYTVRQDFIDPNLLFCGTEFGAYTSTNGGKNWVKLAGLPTIAVYDLDIQKRESDLVAATFGRGFYTLENYSPLRNLTKESLDKPAALFPVEPALLYVPSSPLGLSGTGSQGADMWNADNSPFGATFTFYMKEDAAQSLKAKRQKMEKDAEKEKKDFAYPTIEELRKEQLEESAKLIWIIRDNKNKEVRRLSSSPKKGMQRLTWDLHYETTSPINPHKSAPGRYESYDQGYLAVPGTYSVEVVKIKDGVSEQLIAPTNFEVKLLENRAIQPSPSQELQAFREEVSQMKRLINGSNRLLSENEDKLKLMKYAITNYPNTDLKLLAEVKRLETEIVTIKLKIYGDGLKSSKEFESAPGFWERLGLVEGQLFENIATVSASQKAHLAIVNEEYAQFRTDLSAWITAVEALEKSLDMQGIPYTKNKGKDWKND